MRSSLLALVALPCTLAMPVQVTISQRASECLYEKMDANEKITASVFILAGPELKATMTFDGPLPETAEEPINSGKAMQDAVAKMDSGGFFSRTDTTDMLQISEVVDFEHLNIGDDDDDDFEEEEDHPEEETMEQRRERRARQRKKALEARQRRDQRRIKQREVARSEGEPYQLTMKTNKQGWYRFCLKATWYQVTAEIELRKETEFGGISDSGHVYTVQERAVIAEEEYMKEDTAASEGIKDEDFEQTREKLKTLRRLIADIQSKQSQERHRLIVHAATNEHSHSRMVLSSLMETVLFMAVTGFQVYTIRKWFKGAPVLGR